MSVTRDFLAEFILNINSIFLVQEIFGRYSRDIRERFGRYSGEIRERFGRDSGEIWEIFGRYSLDWLEVRA